MKETRDQLKQQLAQYMEQQPESKKVFHKWMKYLEAVSLGVILAAFLIALYFSITWKSVNPLIIPIAWFAFAASGSLLIALTGVHAAILRGFPTDILPSKAQKFVTGNKAVWIGLGLILGGLAYAAFWGMLAYATWTANYELLRPLIGFLGTVLGLGIAVSILAKMISTTLQRLH
jgi:hypothetical protein